MSGNSIFSLVDRKSKPEHLRPRTARQLRRHSKKMYKKERRPEFVFPRHDQEMTFLIKMAERKKINFLPGLCLGLGGRSFQVVDVIRAGNGAFVKGDKCTGCLTVAMDCPLLKEFYAYVPDSIKRLETKDIGKKIELELLRSPK